MNTKVIERSVIGGMGTWLSAVLLLGVLLLTNAQQIRAQDQEPEDLSECVDRAFAEYNSCLMESSWWFSRAICDFDWEGDMVKCTAEQVGQVRGSASPH